MLEPHRKAISSRNRSHTSVGKWETAESHHGYEHKGEEVDCRLAEHHAGKEHRKASSSPARRQSNALYGAWGDAPHYLLHEALSHLSTRDMEVATDLLRSLSKQHSEFWQPAVTPEPSCMIGDASFMSERLRLHGRTAPSVSPHVAQVTRVTNHLVYAVLQEYMHQMIQLPLELLGEAPQVGEQVTLLVYRRASKPWRHKGEAVSMTDAQPASPLDAAYDELDGLLARRHAEGSTPELQALIDNGWKRLRALQEQAAQEVRKELDASLELPPHELSRVIREAEAILSDEDEEDDE